MRINPTFARWWRSNAYGAGKTYSTSFPRLGESIVQSFNYSALYTELCSSHPTLDFKELELGFIGTQFAADIRPAARFDRNDGKEKGSN